MLDKSTAVSKFETTDIDTSHKPISTMVSAMPPSSLKAMTSSGVAAGGRTLVASNLANLILDPRLHSVRRLIPLPAESDWSAPRETFDVLQDWEGAVEAVGTNTFFARLRDRTAGDPYPEEVAELPIDDVSDDDRELLRPGAIFYLTIGRARRASGRYDRRAYIWFRRLPAWTRSTLESALARAASLDRFLAGEAE